MNAGIKIIAENFEVICRATADDVDIAEDVNSIARFAAATMAASMGLPSFTCDVVIGTFFEYREEVSALVAV